MTGISLSVDGEAFAKPTRRGDLSPRERDVLDWIAEGRSNVAIGRLLGVSEDTVKTHLGRLYRKLGARDRAHAVATGFRLGILS